MSGGAWYLYGLVDRPRLSEALAAAPVEGLSGPVTAIRTAGASLVLAPCDGGPVAPKRRHMKAHLRVLEELMQFGTVLPFRFGHVSPDPDEVLRMIEAAQADVAENFGTVSGYHELGLRVEFDRAAALEASLEADPGLVRLRDRLNDRGGGSRMEQIELGRRVAETLDRRRTTAQRQLLGQLSPLARAHVLEVPEADSQVLKAAFLVAEGAEDDFAAAAETFARDCGFVPGAVPRIRLVGPVPPFSFVSLHLGAEAV